MRHPALATCLTLAALAAAPAARADGLSDLKAALARLQAQTPLKATLDVKTAEKRGEGADAVEKLGQASLGLEDSTRGLQVLYAKDTLARMDAESRAAGARPEGEDAHGLGAGQLDSADVMPMASAAPALSRSLDEASSRPRRPTPSAESRPGCSRSRCRCRRCRSSSAST